MATMKALLFNAYGGIEAVYVGKTTKPVITKDSDILVKVKAAPVNPSDVLYVAGGYVLKASSFPSQAGLEGSGIIEEVGKSAAFKVGQRVHFVGFGTWAEYVLLDTAVNPVIPLPDGVSFEEGAQLTVNPVTVYAMLEVLGAKEGEILVQNAAASCLAKILIQLAKSRGIKTINVVRRDDNIAELKAIGGDYVINSEKEDVVQKVLEISPGGVKYALDAIAGKEGQKLSQVLAEGGTQLVYGLLSGPALDIAAGNVLFKSAAVKGFYLMNWTKSHADRVKQAYATILEALLTKKLQLRYKTFQDPLEALSHSITPGKSDKSLVVFN